MIKSNNQLKIVGEEFSNKKIRVEKVSQATSPIGSCWNLKAFQRPNSSQAKTKNMGAFKQDNNFITMSDKADQSNSYFKKVKQNKDKPNLLIFSERTVKWLSNLLEDLPNE
jgi:hypothetical protein